MDSNEGARPLDPEGSATKARHRTARIAAGVDRPGAGSLAALLGLLLLALLIPLARQALRGSDPGVGGAGNTEGERQGAAG